MGDRCGRSGFKHRCCGLQAGAAIRTGTGAHGQLGHAAAAVGDGFKDLAISDSIADADIHGADFSWLARMGKPISA